MSTMIKQASHARINASENMPKIGPLGQISDPIISTTKNRNSKRKNTFDSPPEKKA